MADTETKFQSLLDLMIVMNMAASNLKPGWAVDPQHDGAATWLKSTFATAAHILDEGLARASLQRSVQTLAKDYFGDVYMSKEFTAPDGETYNRDVYNPVFENDERFHETFWVGAKPLAEAMVARLRSISHGGEADNIVKYYDLACEAFGTEPGNIMRGGQHGWGASDPQP